MEQKFSAEYPQKSERIGSKRFLNYLIQETPMEEIERQWRIQRGDMDGEDIGSPDEWFIKEHKYMYYSVGIALGKWSYDGVVNAIIREKYREDQMEAITNNMNVIVGEFFNQLVTGGIIQATKYLVGSINDANTANFKEMQEWRAMAKSEARGVFKKE